MRRIAKRVAGGIAVVAIVFAAYASWYRFRSQPPPESRMLYEGVRYERRVRAGPNPRIDHIVEVRLDTPGVEVVVSDALAVKGFETRVSRTTEYLARSGVQLAVNGAFYYPFKSGTFAHSPGPGQGAQVLGSWTHRGEKLSKPQAGYHVLVVDYDGQLSIHKDGAQTSSVAYEVSGMPLLVQDGKADLVGPKSVPPDRLGPRTAIGLASDPPRLYLVVIDGRQPGYSMGATLYELADLFVELGAHTALNLDGGGSTTLVVDDEGPQVLNMPIHRRHPPGRVRPVVNHLGIIAPALRSP